MHQRKGKEQRHGIEGKRKDERKPYTSQANRPPQKKGWEGKKHSFTKSPKGKLPPNTLRVSGQIATLNLTPGKSHLGETRTIIGNDEYRLWDPKSSKLCAALHNGLNYPETPDRPIILYLGASFGNTVSHLSDIYPNGIIYAVESAIEPLRQLALLSLKRKNIIPIYDDANYPENYSDAVPQADIIYMDVAQKNQVQILKKNMAYASERTIIMFCVKARSIDVSLPPSRIFMGIREELKDEMKIVHETRLEPFEKDHLFMTMKRRE
jgi:fibrillarin-like pre-rRNA processing protein